MKFVYFLFLVCCLKQTPLVTSYEIASQIMDAASFKVEKINKFWPSKKMNQKLETLLPRFKDAIDEVSNDFFEKIDPVLKDISDDLCKRKFKLPSLNETSRIFEKAIADFKFSNITEVCTNTSLLSTVLNKTDTYLCDDKPSLVKLIGQAYDILDEFGSDIVKLRTGFFNLLEYKTRLVQDEVHSYYTSLNTLSDCIEEFLEHLKKETNLVLEDEDNYHNQKRAECYAHFDKDWIANEVGEWEMRPIMFKKRKAAFDEMFEMAVEFDTKLFDDIFDQVERQFLDKTLGRCVGRYMAAQIIHTSQDYSEIQIKNGNTFAAKIDYPLIKFFLDRVREASKHFSVPDEVCEVANYVGKAEKFLCKMYDRVEFIFETTTSIIMKPIEKLKSYVPCFLQELGAYAIDKTEDVLGEVGFNDLIDYVEKVVSEIAATATTIIKDVFEEFGTSCTYGLEMFEPIVDDLMKAITKCELITKIEKLGDYCNEKPANIENALEINEITKELPALADVFKDCVLSKFNDTGVKLIETMEKCFKF